MRRSSAESWGLWGLGPPLPPAGVPGRTAFSGPIPKVRDPDPQGPPRLVGESTGRAAPTRLVGRSVQSPEPRSERETDRLDSLSTDPHRSGEVEARGLFPRPARSRRSPHLGGSDLAEVRAQRGT